MSFKRLFLALTFAMIASAATHRASAQCSLQTLQGAFGVTTTGFSVTTAGTFPFAGAGSFTFDGVVGVATLLTLSANGDVLLNQANPGVYTVNTDCTGTLSFAIAGGAIPFTLNLIIDDNNKEIRAISTTQGTVLTIEGRKQVSTTTTTPIT